jgi:hypothetical protein
MGKDWKMEAKRARAREMGEALKPTKLAKGARKVQ